MQRGGLALVSPKEGPAVGQFRWSENSMPPRHTDNFVFVEGGKDCWDSCFGNWAGLLCQRARLGTAHTSATKNNIVTQHKHLTRPRFSERGPFANQLFGAHLG